MSAPGGRTSGVSARASVPALLRSPGPRRGSRSEVSGQRSALSPQSSVLLPPFAPHNLPYKHRPIKFLRRSAPSTAAGLFNLLHFHLMPSHDQAGTATAGEMRREQESPDRNRHPDEIHHSRDPRPGWLEVGPHDTG